MRVHRTIAIALLIAVCCALAPLQAHAEKLVVKKVTELGTKVFLTDGSEWKVPNPDDWDVAYEWLPGHPVQLLDGGGIMLNTKTGQRINVKRTQSKPEPGAAPAKPADPVVLTHPALSPISTQTGGGTDAITEKRLEKLENGLESLENKLDILLQRLEQMEKRQSGK